MPAPDYLKLPDAEYDTPDRTVAIRALRQGGQEVIGALACNQDLVPRPDDPPDA